MSHLNMIKAKEVMCWEYILTDLGAVEEGGSY